MSHEETSHNKYIQNGQFFIIIESDINMVRIPSMSIISRNFDIGVFNKKDRIMKTNVIAIMVFAVFFIPLEAQKVSNFSYKFDNGTVITMEKDWGHVWVQQRQDAFAPNEDPQSVVISVRTMGDLSKGSTFKLTSGGKDVRMKDASAGTYDLKVTTALAEMPGSISFDVNGIVVKPKMKTTVSITIYSYQVYISEAQANNNGLAGYDSKVYKYKGNSQTSPTCGRPEFYPKGNHQAAISPDQKTDALSGKIKPGTYDVRLTFDVCGSEQKIWLNNMTFKPNVNYKINTNLNAGDIAYGGTVRDVSKIHMYPAGTADRMQGVAKPDKTREILCYDPANQRYPCPPGSYDVLLNIGNGTRYQWIKNFIVRTGTRADVR